MSKHCEYMSDRLTTRASWYGEDMDVLTNVLAALETGPTLCAQTRAHAPWGLRFGGNQGFGFHVVLQGTCWVSYADEPPRALRPGDVMLMASGKEHTLADAPTTPAVIFRLEPERHTNRIARQHVAGAVGG